MHDSGKGVVYPGSLKVDGKLFEDVVGYEEGFVFDVGESCVHPDEVVGVVGIVGEGFCHEEEFREENGVVHFDLILYVFLIEEMFGNGEVVIDDVFHFGSVPLLLKPTEVFIDEDGVGVVAMLLHEELELVVTEDDQVGVGLQQLGEEVQIVVEATTVVFHLASFDVPETCDDGDHRLTIGVGLDQGKGGCE